MYTNGREKEALALFKRVFERESRWVPLVPRLARVGLFPDDPKKIAEVQSMAPAAKTAAKPPATSTKPATTKKSPSSHH
jgi:hypothetical protein